MTILTQTWDLGAYHITKDLVKNIQEYLPRAIDNVLHLEADAGNMEHLLQENMTIALKYPNREETYQNLDSYISPIFHDNIQSATISLTLPAFQYLKTFKLNLCFSKIEEDCLLTITVPDYYALEKAAGIVAGLLNIIEPNRNTRSPYLFVPLGLMILATVVLVAVNIHYDQFLAYKKAYVFNVIALLYSIITINRMKGVCSFETSKQKRMDYWLLWLVSGFSTVILFATLVYALRRALLGF